MMVEVVSIIVESLVTVGIFLALFFGFKHWVDKGGVDKVITKCNDELSAKNKQLRKELEAYKSINKDFEFLLKHKQEEIEDLYLQIEALKEDDKEEQNDADGK